MWEELKVGFRFVFGQQSLVLTLVSFRHSTILALAHSSSFFLVYVKESSRWDPYNWVGSGPLLGWECCGLDMVGVEKTQ